jgi:hypothetical protein
MSLFGKILLVFNILGAGALGYLAVQTYAKRQAFSQAAMTYNWMLDGLPVDTDELDEQGQPLVERMADSVRDHLFSGVGRQPMATQADEVRRVQGLVESRLGPVQADKLKHAHTLARILLPFADFTLERDQLIAARTHLADQQSVDALRERYNAALRNAKELLAREKAQAKPGDRPRSNEDAFRLEFRALPGLPSDALTRMIADGLPADLNTLASVDLLFDQALERQRQQFQAKLDGIFLAARTGPKEPSNRKASLATQKAEIARMLFGMSVSLAGDDLNDKAARDAQGMAMRRMYVVCGLRVGLDAVSERTEILKQLAMLEDSAAAQERQLFLADLAFLVESARDQAAQVASEALAIADSRQKVADQMALVAKRQADVKAAKEAYADAQARTAERLGELRKMSDELLRDRLSARDKIEELLKRNAEIEKLEKRLRELQTNKKKTP